MQSTSNVLGVTLKLFTYAHFLYKNLFRLINIFLFLLNNTKTSWIFKFFSSSAYSYILFVVCFSFFFLFLFTSMTTLLLFHIMDAYWDLPRYYWFLCIGLHFTALTLHLESSCVWLKSLEKWKWLQILPYSSCGEIELIFLTWTWAGLWQLRSVDCGSSDNHASFGCVWELKPSSAVVSESSMMTWRKHEKALCWHDMPALPERPHREGWRITRREVRSG